MAKADLRYGDEVVRLKADGRFELTPHGQRMVEAVRMAEAAAATKKALPQPPQQEINRRFHDAMREEIIKLSALAQKTLQANPYRADGDGEEEAKLRELAHADRQLLPLHDALIKADEPNSESAEYREGFRFRLMEAMATIAEVCEYDPLHHRLRQRRVGGKNRPKAISPFTQFITSYLKRNPQACATEVAAALTDDAREGHSGQFELSRDASAILTTGDRAKRLKVSGIPAAVTKAKKKF